MRLRRIWRMLGHNWNTSTAKVASSISTTAKTRRSASAPARASTSVEDNDRKTLHGWGSVDQYLRHARIALREPSQSDSVAYGRAVRAMSYFTEFLSHNELALALGELEVLGNLSPQSAEFWAYLEKAAGLMDLPDKAAEYRLRAAGDGGKA